MPFGRIVGAFIFPEFWDNQTCAEAATLKLRDCGVNAIMTESDNYESFWLDTAHKAGLRFYAGVACFSDHGSEFRCLEGRPELWPILETGEHRPQMEWYVGMSPTDRRRQEKVLADIGRIARTNAIDGLFLDFVRWPLHWEIELRPGRPKPPDSSFDATTLTKFEEATGAFRRAGLDTVPARAAWIHENRFREWVDFKCKVITDFVRDARNVLKGAKSDAELGIYVVPDINGLTEPLTGQRISDLAPLVDWVAPMLYHNILLQPPRWVGSALADVDGIARGKALPVIQADSNRDPSVAGDWGPPMSDTDWGAALAQVVGAPRGNGLIVFPGAALLGVRGQTLRTMLGAPP